MGMIGNSTFKYLLLQEGDIIKQGDEYYNPKFDLWLLVDSGLDEGDDSFIGEEYSFAEMKPMRRLNTLTPSKQGKLSYPLSSMIY